MSTYIPKIKATFARIQCQLEPLTCICSTLELQQLPSTVLQIKCRVVKGAAAALILPKPIVVAGVTMHVHLADGKQVAA
jgi:hypothetical protein